MKKFSQPLLVVASASVALLGIAGCGGSTSTASGAASTHAATSTAATPSSSPTATPTVSTSAGAMAVADVAGYKYATLAAELQPIITGLKATTLVSNADGREILSASGEDVGALVLAQYNASLVPSLDKTPITKVLDGAATGAKAMGGVGAKISDHVVAGTHVRLLAGKDLSIAIAYKPGGLLIEVFGPSSATVLDFAGKYLTASA